MDYSNMTLTEKRDLLFAQPVHVQRDTAQFNINADFLKYNSDYFAECERELFVSLFPMLPLLEQTVALEDADYILYSHPYARVEDMSPFVLAQLHYIDEHRRPGAEIIVVGKSSNAEELLAGSIGDIVFWPNHYAELVAQKFGMDFKDEYFVFDIEDGPIDTEAETYDSSLGSKNARTGVLNIWPVNGCLRKCKFCRRSYMDIPFESLSLEYIKNQLDWYKEHYPKRMCHIRLRAENLTEYGRDLPGNPTLADLFDLVSSYDEVEGISVLIGLAFCEFTDAMVDSVRRSGKFVFMAFNLEAGSPTLLRTIGKNHTPERALYITQRIREAIPDIFFSTTVMVGLPTETLADIHALADLCINTTMNYVQVNLYGSAPKYPLNSLPQLSPQLREYHLRLAVRLIKQKKLKSPNKDILIIGHERKYRRGSRIELRNMKCAQEQLEKYCTLAWYMTESAFVPQRNRFIKCNDEYYENYGQLRSDYLESIGII